MKNIVFDLGRVLLDYQPLVWLKRRTIRIIMSYLKSSFKILHGSN